MNKIYYFCTHACLYACASAHKNEVVQRMTWPLYFSGIMCAKQVVVQKCGHHVFQVYVVSIVGEAAASAAASGY